MQARTFCRLSGKTKPKQCVRTIKTKSLSDIRYLLAFALTSSLVIRYEISKRGRLESTPT